MPLLESIRRGTDFSNPAGYLDDFVIGGLLAYAAWSAGRGRRYADGLLIAGWGGLCGGLYYSVLGQIAARTRPDISGLSGNAVLAIKLVIALIALVCLWLSIWRVSKQPSDLATTD